MIRLSSSRQHSTESSEVTDCTTVTPITKTSQKNRTTLFYLLNKKNTFNSKCSMSTDQGPKTNIDNPDDDNRGTSIQHTAIYSFLNLVRNVDFLPLFTLNEYLYK